ncbi:MAG TPA: hypothetical protein VLB46_05540 [Pyrinomonadaceae bacterium]|nr:hypothetical protein [Pyrinomonadaceae bacterium]
MKLLYTLLLVSTIGLITAAALAHRRPPAHYLTSQTLAQDPNAAVQAELITITSTGFEPTELTRLNGRFLLAIDNRSGLDDVQLYFERETGGPVNVPLGRRRRLAWREIIDLQPGTYILRARNDESWRCRITITR